MTTTNKTLEGQSIPLAVWEPMPQTDVLALLGMTHRATVPSDGDRHGMPGRRTVVDAAGRIVGVFRCDELWAHLINAKLIEPRQAHATWRR